MLRLLRPELRLQAKLVLRLALVLERQERAPVQAAVAQPAQPPTVPARLAPVPQRHRLLPEWANPFALESRAPSAVTPVQLPRQVHPVVQAKLPVLAGPGLRV